ncbi:MAG: sulfatase-like hydrolase/transferase [Mogibacterium sp.]|nr:sulfatase-like hydrolase/transferase [Mogibacterium sp.]
MKKLSIRRTGEGGGRLRAFRQKFRRRFPKKEPRVYDADVHEGKYILRMLLFSFLIYLYIETFARATDGLLEGLLMIVRQPLVFLINWWIIFATLSVSLLFRKRGFVTLIISLVWLLAGTANGCILIKRMTPFTLYDLQNLADGLTLLTTYYSNVQIILGGIAASIVIAIVILFFLRCPRWQHIKYRRSVLTVAAAVGIAIGGTMLLIQQGVLSTFFGNLNYAYTDYGFPYCFINTSLNTGISRPDDYSETMIRRILEEHTEKGTKRTIKKVDNDDRHPNIIILQMESMTYAQDYHNIEVSNDPTPVFTDLMEHYSTGWFEVPACGAGTANTEFEILTGISAKFFGPGEYPYKGKLREQTLESMAYVLRNRGYTTSALHDHRALFYNRNEVYANLGFDSYTSVEYMNNISKTPTGWARDEVLTDNIIDIMKTTKSRDFLHVISVQGHGSYPTEQVFKEPYTVVSAEDEETRWKYEYYINECHEMDTFIGDLLGEIEKTGEPTIVLIYGDHIPALDVKESDYADGNLYKTRYVIWDNMGLEKEDRYLYSYQAGAVLLERAGYAHLGTIFDYQQTTDSEEPTYLSDQKALAYDMLYGDNFVFNGRVPYKTVDMKMGFKDIVINDILRVGDSYYIRGENFTEHSTVSMDGRILKTIYLSPSLLGLQEEVDPADVYKLQVSQIDTKDDTILTTIDALEEL